MAAALVALMRELGHERFALAGHDRGARAGYRLVLDHPGVVTRFASLAVVPTLDALEGVDHRFARNNYHWFLMAQEPAIAEAMLAAAPDAVLEREFASKKAAGADVIEDAARNAYHAAFRDPAVRHAMCEDYRAALEEDLAADSADRQAGRRLDCPVLALWPRAQEAPGRPRPADVWKRWAADVSEGVTTGHHLQAEDRPEEVGGALLRFFGAEAVHARKAGCEG